MKKTNTIRKLLRRRFRGLWLSRDFRKLWASLTITSFGAQITNLALPLTAALLLNATPMQMGILVALETLPFALVSLHAGVLLDRVRKLPIVIVADIGRGLALLAIPLTAWLGVLSIDILFVVGFLCGVQNVIGGAAYQVLLAQMAGRKRLVEANAKTALGETSAALIAPGIAGRLDPDADGAVRDRARCRRVFRLRPAAAPGRGRATTCRTPVRARRRLARDRRRPEAGLRAIARCGLSPGWRDCGSSCITCRSRC